MATQPRVIESRRMPLNGDRDTPGTAGGSILLYKAETATWLIGDVCIVSATIDDSVVKSVTAADAPKLAGVIVGGGSVGGYDPAFFGIGTVGLSVLPARSQVGAIGMTLLVQINGIAWVVADGTIARGATVGIATTAGRVIANATANQIIGTALRGATIGVALPIQLW